MKARLTSYCLLAAALLLTASTVWATPYITPEQWAEMSRKPVLRTPLPYPGMDAVNRRLLELQDQGYSYMFEYIQICDFLAVWQVSDTTSPNYGGMIEGESGDLTRIIQTDNTQEAIRVWSHYGAMSGDLERYRDNIDAAWIYTMNFPAYSEEGDTDYYRAHNCGWGLVAQMEYQDIYGDTTYRVYADSCADYIMTHPLSFTNCPPFYQDLHPLVTGWAAGTLYKYGQYVGNQAYIDSALVQGNRVKAWIEENPGRLSTNEVWAMSGGTAMWGLVESVFREDSLGGVAWLGTYAPHMNVIAGSGAWNNSWNIWYSHAHRAIYDLTGDSLFQYNAVFLVDTILAQDGDNDGGVPAGMMDPDSMDQTWVSCYTDYMGIEKILNTLPIRDAGVAGYHYPRAGAPIELGTAVDIMPLVANYGSAIIDTVWLYVTAPPNYTGHRTTILPYTGMDSVLVYPTWLPMGPGIQTLTAYTVLPGDMNPANDTARIDVDIRNHAYLWGAVRNEAGEGLNSRLHFYHQQVSDSIPLFSVQTFAPHGSLTVFRMWGEYRVEVVPEIPYNIRSFHPVNIIDSAQVQYDFILTPSEFLLVDDDEGADYERFVKSSLEDIWVDYYYWSRADSGALNGISQLFPNIIWMTGNDSTTTLETDDKNELTAFLEGGGNLLLSGQNIGDDLGSGDPFLNDYLKVRHEQDSVNQFMLNGFQGHPFAGGTSLMIVGGTGAGNQRSVSTCAPLAGGEAAYYYLNPPQPTASVSYIDPVYGYRTVYMGFGIEAVSGLANTITRAELLRNIFEWWGYPVETASRDRNLVTSYKLNAPYPNPFNPATEISYSIPRPGEVELAVYNILGQKVAVLWNGFQSPGEYCFRWEGKSNSGSALGGGVYFCRLRCDGGSFTRRIVLLK